MAIGQLSTSLCCIIIMMLISLGGASAGAETIASPPPYQLNRADDDYGYLREPARRTDFWDPIKYMPLNASGSWYLSLGGEARERYEYFNNPNWGSDPLDLAMSSSATFSMLTSKWASNCACLPSYRAAWRTAARADRARPTRTSSTCTRRSST